MLAPVFHDRIRKFIDKEGNPAFQKDRPRVHLNQKWKKKKGRRENTKTKT